MMVCNMQHCLEQNKFFNMCSKTDIKSSNRLMFAFGDNVVYVLHIAFKGEYKNLI